MDRPSEANRLLESPAVSRLRSPSRRAVRQLRIGHQTASVREAHLGAVTIGDLQVVRLLVRELRVTETLVTPERAAADGPR